MGWGDSVSAVAARVAKLCERRAMSMNVETEIRELKRRVSEIEGSFRLPTQQIKSVHKDLLVFQEKKTEQRFDQADGNLDKVGGRLDLLDRGLRGLRTDMPKIVGDAVRDALGGRPRSKS